MQRRGDSRDCPRLREIRPRSWSRERAADCSVPVPKARPLRTGRSKRCILLLNTPQSRQSSASVVIVPRAVAASRKCSADVRNPAAPHRDSASSISPSLATAAR